MMNMQKANILLIEDDHDLGNLLKLYLEQENYQVFLERNGNNFLNIIRDNDISICIFDVMLPGENGYSIAEKVKLKYPKLPFLFLTARKQKEDRLKGLKLGADDYITKPFEADEMVLRIKNILKRTGNLTLEKIQIGTYLFDLPNLLLIGQDNSRTLTIKEAALIEYLYKNQGRLIKKSDILQDLWGEDDYFLGRSMDVFISRIRKYFSADDSIQIENMRGIGLIFKIKDQ
jgi:DNA-binding response OmpR family regulator